jgi:hypothetical protein
VAADDNDAVARVELFLDGQLLDMVLAPPYEFALNTAHHPSGEHVVQAVVYDRCLNEAGPSRSVTFLSSSLTPQVYLPLVIRQYPSSALVIDDFEGYSDDAGLNAAYTINDIGGANVGQISLAYPPNVGSGGQGAVFYYQIRNSAPADYVGFERRFAAQDWQGHSALRVWIKSDGSNRDLAIQFGEASGEVWRCQVNLSSFGAQDFQLALDESTFQWADWSGWENGMIDLDAVDYYAFFVGGGLGEGTIYIDELRLTP